MFDFTGLFLYKIIFTIEILIAMHIFSFNFQKKSHFVIRVLTSITICIFISIIFPVKWDICYSWWYSSLMFFILFLFCAASLLFVYKVNWQKLFMNCITAYTSQHLAYQIFSAIINIVDVKDVVLANCYTSEEIVVVDGQMNILFFCILIIIYSLVYYVLYSLFIKKNNSKDNNEKIKNYYIVMISMMILLVDVILNSIYIYSGTRPDKTASLLICSYNILCCLLVLFVQFGILENKNLRYEMVMLSQFLTKKEEQYERNKENIEQINLKVHDLKHQIHEYANKGQIHYEIVSDLNNLVQIYDSNPNSGNAAFDLIVSEQSIRCKKQNIDLKCYADCSKLDFISEVDIYSLFGNILDNAIEASEKIKDESKRKIHLNVKNSNCFVSICVENYFEGELIMSGDGLFSTTKENSFQHGYGLKSIRLIVEKYNGSVTFKSEQNIFIVSILFSLKKSN